MLVHRQQESQEVATAAVKRELEEMQELYGGGKELLTIARRESRVKQRLQHDLGGLTDTVVSGVVCEEVWFEGWGVFCFTADA